MLLSVTIKLRQSAGMGVPTYSLCTILLGSLSERMRGGERFG